MTAAEAITHFVRACEPNESLRPSDTRYINCDAVRGESRIADLERSLRRMAPDKFDKLLFTGHRGAGKTSELMRLKELLEERSDLKRPFEVVYFDVTESLDPNDLEFPDLLILTASSLMRQLRSSGIPGFDTVQTYLKDVWDGIRSSLGGQVVISDAEIDIAFGKLTVELRNRPSARKALRNAIELHTSQLLNAVNDLLRFASQSLQRADYQGLVLIVDGLDKIVFRPLDDGRSNTHLRLFCDRADQLTKLNAHTIYTVPISLIYSPRCAELEQTFGLHITPLPMVRLRGENKSDSSPTSPGILKMIEMVKARCIFAGQEMDSVFDNPETVYFLCQMTGGHPRHLVMFLQAAANSIEVLPITRESAERAVRNYANSLIREIPSSLWAKLRSFSTPQRDIPKDDDHQQMLFLLYVFEYMNGEPWYEVNPVIRQLAKFSE